MLERPVVIPALNAGDVVDRDIVLAHLRQWQSDTKRTRETIRTLRQGVDETSRQMENPKAAYEYLDFFDGFFSHAVDALETIIGELPNGFEPAHADTLRQLASNAAGEMRRTVVFRDKWVNKPLPYDTVRPMLTQAATDVRDQLTDYREMALAANVLVDISAAPSIPAEPRPEGLGRRELLSRFVRPLGDVIDK